MTISCQWYPVFGTEAVMVSRMVCIAAWPTGELGGMGLEGDVKLGFKKEHI